MEQRAGSRQYTTFVVEDLFFGVDVLRVQEVLRYQDMTAVPRSDGTIEGLINLRGQIVTALDMRRRLGLAHRTEGQTPMNVVLQSDDGAVSLLVDDIGDVIAVDPEAFEPPPATLEPAASEMLEGVYKLDDRLLLVLASEQLLEA